MSSETQRIYDKAVATLRARPDFENIDLEMVQVWAVGYFILSGPSPTDADTIKLFVGLKEFINTIADILNLEKVN